MRVYSFLTGFTKVLLIFVITIMVSSSCKTKGGDKDAANVAAEGNKNIKLKFTTGYPG